MLGPFYGRRVIVREATNGGSVVLFTAVVLELGVQAHEFINLDLQSPVPYGEVGINVPCPSACPRWGMIFLQRNFVHL